ncbi:MAG: hypothetical protein ACYCZY_02725 [Lacisediminihabitans sp.]
MNTLLVVNPDELMIAMSPESVTVELSQVIGFEQLRTTIRVLPVCAVER